MSPWPFRRAVPFRRFPRVSGDEPMLDLTVRAMTAFSPRERG